MESVSVCIKTKSDTVREESHLNFLGKNKLWKNGFSKRDELTPKDPEAKNKKIKILRLIMRLA